MNVQIVQLNVINDYVVDIIVQLRMKLVDRPRGKGLFNKTTTFLLFECNYEIEATDTYIYKPQIESKKKKIAKEKFVLFFGSSISLMPSAFGQVCRIVFLCV